MPDAAATVGLRPSRPIVIPDAPLIERLRFRTYQADVDARPWAGLINAANAANGITEVYTEGGVRHELANLTNIDPAEDFVLAFVGERLVAGSEIEWSDTTSGSRGYYSRGYVHPEWRRRGLGSAMLARNESRLRHIAAGHELVQPPVLMTWIPDSDPGGVALVRRRDYRHVRVYHHMVRPDLDGILVPPLPEGLEIRPLDEADLKPMWDGLIEAFRDHFGVHDGSEASFRRHVGDPTFDLALCVAAFEGSEMAGGVQGGIDPDENRIQGYQRGWADPVWVRRPWRRRGLASALLGRCLVLLRDRGMTSAQLEVDAENPNEALGLYERHRFRVDYSDSEWHRPLTLQ